MAETYLAAIFPRDKILSQFYQQALNDNKMAKKTFSFLSALLFTGISFCQNAIPDIETRSFHKENDYNNQLRTQFIATSHLLDAALNSLNSLNSLIKKENYRNKITAFNNPASSDLGFSLEVEIQAALKPILDKTKNINGNKFSAVVTSLINNPAKNQFNKTAFGASTVFSTLLSLVGNLTVVEKKVTRQDLDSFMFCMSKYFVQYEKLNLANMSFDQDIDKFNNRLQELQFDIREFMLDIIIIINKDLQRSRLKQKNLEELLLDYLDKDVLDTIFEENLFTNDTIPVRRYPGDGIKTSKEIAYDIQKLFTEYQKIYAI